MIWNLNSKFSTNTGLYREGFWLTIIGLNNLEFKF